ncbi:MAG: pilus assembly PilX N-terminal domain-containing protein [Pseudomonadota bacterium]
MRVYNLANKIKQQGLTTLIISSILLFAACLIGLFSSKSIILEQKISANNYRSDQAFYNADALLNKISSILDQQPITTNNKTSLPLDQQTLKQQQQTLAIVSYFEADTNYNHITIEAYSDDKTSTQVTSQSLAAVPIAGNGAGKIVSYPLITRLGIDLTENLSITNSYAKNTIWSGGKVLLNHSESFVPAFKNNKKTMQQILKTPLSLGVDIIDKDFNLQQFSRNQFFENFLNEKASFIKHLAKDNALYFSAALVQKMDQKNGLIWLGDGDKQITLDNAVIGTKEKSVILIVDCSNNTFTTRGTIVIHGLVYIRGDWFPSGNIIVHGAIIVEGKILATENKELVYSQIIYTPKSLKPDPPLANTMARVIGSWRDF